MTQSIENKILKRIRAKRRGWVFTPKHFSDLGSSEAVKISLIRLEKDKLIDRVGRGLFYYPKKHPKLGILAPSIDQIAQAIKERDSIRMQPSGAYAANLLGLSLQVPLRAVFLTDGSPKELRVGNQIIELKKTDDPDKMATEGRISGIVTQALQYIGKDNINQDVVATLKKRLSDDEKQTLLADIQYAPEWIRKIIRDITQDV
ncbi:MAG: DUF6088 family protein [Verrucomicrobiota bacterium]